MKAIRNAMARLRSASAAAADYGRGVWRRLTTEPGYAEAAASALVSVVALLSSNQRLVRFTHDVATTPAALVETLIRARDECALPRHLGVEFRGLSGSEWSNDLVWD